MHTTMFDREVFEHHDHNEEHNKAHDEHIDKMKKYFQNFTKDKDIFITMTPFATGGDEIYHQQLLRLATEFYGFDLDSDLGRIQFEMFMHTYDISPGEEYLDRSHPTPTPIHSYDELPIIKYDGYEDSDDPDIYQLGQHSNKHH